jgi:predicted GIY-YIG superfamily endonuclease
LVPLDRPAARAIPKPYYLYRLYGAVRMFPGGPVVRPNGLLYVGISEDPPRRLGQHRADRWWGADITEQVVAEDVYPSKELAETVEAKAIRKERPPHNRKHNPDGSHRSSDGVRVAA